MSLAKEAVTKMAQLKRAVLEISIKMIPPAISVFMAARVDWRPQAEVVVKVMVVIFAETGRWWL